MTRDSHWSLFTLAHKSGGRTLVRFKDVVETEKPITRLVNVDSLPDMYVYMQDDDAYLIQPATLAAHKFAIHWHGVTGVFMVTGAKLESALSKLDANQLVYKLLL